MSSLKELFAEPVTGVLTEIAPGDEMVGKYPEAFFRWGQEALKSIRLALLLAGKTEVASILDLPCGHGRVLRALQAAFPAARLTACDLNRDGVDFCASRLGAVPVYSRTDPREIPLSGEFDLIWVGSLLTHLDADRWGEFLGLFSEHLAPGGVLVFTTHGPFYDRGMRDGSLLADLPRAVKDEILSDYERSGFGYRDYPGQHGYGISLSSAAWVCREVERTRGLSLLGYTERGWGGFQDVVACLGTRA